METGRPLYAEPRFATKVIGSDNPLYDFPDGTRCFADLADGMSFNRGSILKSTLRWGEKDGTSLEYDLEKIIWYASRELRLVRKGKRAATEATDELATGSEETVLGVPGMQDGKFGDATTKEGKA